jgi:hypothetical protein
MTNLNHTQLLDPPIDASDPGNADRVTTTMTQATKPYFVEEAEARWYGNSLWEFLLPERATGGQPASGTVPLDIPAVMTEQIRLGTLVVGPPMAPIDE